MLNTQFSMLQDADTKYSKLRCAANGIFMCILQIEELSESLLAAGGERRAGRCAVPDPVVDDRAGACGIAVDAHASQFLSCSDILFGTT